jgi:hypothetical protein
VIPFFADNEAVTRKGCLIVTLSNNRMLVLLGSLERNLFEERKIVSEAIFGQGGIPNGLAYPAVPENYIHKLNLQCLDDANYVLLLVGSEYGALSDRGVSYLHAVYAAAQAKQKPIVSLIYQGDKKPSFDLFDQKRLSGFIDLLHSKPVYYWHDKTSLRDAAERAVEEIFEAYPSNGWVKVGSDDAYESGMIDKLKEQVSLLSRKLASQRTKETRVQPSDIFKNCEPLMLKYHCNAFREGRLRQLDGSIQIGFQQIFENIGASLLAPANESKVKLLITNPLTPEVLDKAKSTWPDCHAVSDIKIDQVSFDRIKLKLKKLHLIQFDRNGRWQLSIAGEQLMLTLSSD